MQVRTLGQPSRSQFFRNPFCGANGATALKDVSFAGRTVGVKRVGKCSLLVVEWMNAASRVVMDTYKIPQKPKGASYLWTTSTSTWCRSEIISHRAVSCGIKL